MVVRIFDISGKPSEGVIKCFKPMKEAFHTNLIEEVLNPQQVLNGTLPVKTDPFSIETYLIK